MVQQYGTIYTKTITATSDSPFQVDNDHRNVLTSVNIHCYTNDVKYGNIGEQNGIIRANAVAWFDGIVRVCDLWFVNNVAGSNATITVVGLLLNPNKTGYT